MVKTTTVVSGSECVKIKQTTNINIFCFLFKTGSTTPAKKPSSPPKLPSSGSPSIMKYFSPKKDEGTPSKATKRPSTSDDEGENASPSKQSRQECKYGANCYQKNPAHFAKFYHPPATPVADDGVSLCGFITKTCPCNIQRFFSVQKSKIFIRKILIFFLFLLKT